ncbi:hypothetical protein Plec18167_003091 [Paecilomyces lecythidis]|uniref:Uncharacterized protein n=1 Tax=Paecilomyces lecythidis TaxID=3004212 RepID=A0ABR3Y0P1_9EURO
MGSHGASLNGQRVKEFYIFGNGITFSISPVIHNTGFQHDNLPYKYSIRESPSIDGVADLINDESFGGASVTMPHKLQAHKFCHKQSDTAKAIGAINTLIVEGEGKDRTITGDNTDWSGLCNIVTKYCNRSKRTLNSGLVIGAGGASRAALYALHRAGVKKIYMVNRTYASAESVRDAFAKLFSIEVLPSLQDLPQYPDVIISTIPANLYTPDQFKNIFGPGGLCIDMSYKPRRTPLLAAAEARDGWETIKGVEVLLAQGFDQYRLWTGRDAPRQAIVDAVNAHEGAQAAAAKISIEGKL